MLDTASQLSNIPQTITNCNITKPPYAEFLRYCKVCGEVLHFNGKRGRKTEFCPEHQSLKRKTPYWTKEQRDYILERDDNTCVYCGVKTNGVDHVLPLTRGGIHSVTNGVACCKLCNIFKYTRLDWRGIWHLEDKGEDLSWFKDIVLGEQDRKYAVHVYKDGHSAG